MDKGEEALDVNYFNQPTIVMSSGNLKNNASAGLVSLILFICNLVLILTNFPQQIHTNYLVHINNSLRCLQIHWE